MRKAVVIIAVFVLGYLIGQLEHFVKVEKGRREFCDRQAVMYLNGQTDWMYVSALGYCEPETVVLD